jgi:MerR family mercuric resistance operon transcriptional regulator
MARELTIGKIAKLAGVHVETIRYYQRRGLLSEPERPHRGYRRYPADIVEHIRFIKRAQSLGFALNEVAVLMELEEARACGVTRRLALDKMNAIDQKLDGLTSMRRALAALVQQCGAGRSTTGCPIIRALGQDESSGTASIR